MQLRVTLGPDPDEATPEDASAATRTKLVAEVSTLPVAPPLAVRPVEDADWTFRN